MARKTKIQLSSLLVIALIVAALVPGLMSTAGVAQSVATEVERFAAPTVLLSDGRTLSIGGAATPSRELRIIDSTTGRAATLRETLRIARSGHTATVLPDGRILVFGGMGTDGHLVTQAEVSDAALQRFELFADAGLAARTGHSATVLTDGQLLVIGGRDAHGTIVDQAELWNSRTNRSEELPRDLLAARAGHEATLLADGRVHIRGGRDSLGARAEAAIFDPSQGRFLAVEPGAPVEPVQGTATLAGSKPELFERNVPVDAIIGLRFSRPLDLASVSDRTITLVGPAGGSDVRIVAAEGGTLVFLTPVVQLYPGSNYTVFVSGARARDGAAVPFAAFSFDTAVLGGDASGAPPSPAGSEIGTPVKPPAGAKPPALPASAAVQPGATDDDDDWTPDARHRRGQWRTGRHAPHALKDKGKASRNAYTGGTALAGQVLRLNGKPLRGVAVSVGGARALTNDDGAFILNGLAAGRHEMVIDGRRDRDGLTRSYGHYVASVDLKAGKLNEVRYTIWMPKIRARDVQRIASPTKRETVITHPDAPGFELRLPPGTVIRDREGRIVTELAITPVPVDQAPFPIPENFPVYFMIHPGGAVIQGLDPKSSSGVRVIYPNYLNAAPGAEARFWSFNPRDRGWFVYGKGKVSADGTQVVPDPGVALYDWMAFGYGIDNPGKDGPQPALPPCEDGACCGGGPATAGDPVDCFSGVFVHSRADMVINDVMPVVIQRTHRAGDVAGTLPRPFGHNATHSLAMYLQAPLINGQRTANDIDLILSNGARLRYKLVGGDPGTIGGGIWEHTASASRFHKSRMIQRLENPKSWEITLRDGTRYHFSDHGLYLIGMVDRFGNSVEFTESAGNITRLDTENGRYVELFYDASSRIQEIRSFEGRSVTYEYDPVSGMLTRVNYPDGTFEQYGYDGERRMTTVRDRRGNVMVTNEHDAAGRVSRQTLADSAVYLFSYVVDVTGRVIQTDVTDPRGFVRRIFFDTPTGYPTGEIRAAGTSVAQTTTTERDPGSGLPLLVTDALGRKTRYHYDLKGNITSITYLEGTAGAITEGFTWTPDFNQIATYADPLNRTTTLTYDALGRLTQVQDPLGQITQIAQDDKGRLSQILEPVTSRFVTLTYDSGGLRSRNDSGRVTTFHTDAAGRVITIVSPAGEQTRYQYDLNDRLTAITDPQGGLTQLSFDAHGNLQQVIDPKGATRTFGYDGRNRLASRTHPTTQVETFEYDGRNKLTRQTDRFSRITDYEYDPLNRLQRVLFPDGAIHTLTFDAGNRLRSVADSVNPAANVTRDYDNLDRLINEATTLGTVSYTYDNASRRTGMSVSGQAPISYGYDNADRLRTITQGASIAALDYDTAFRRTRLGLPNGIDIAYNYNASDLTGIDYKLGANVLGNLSYEYDLAGRITNIGGTFADINLPTAASATHGVDHRLNTQNADVFTYDGGGNLLTRTDSCGTTNYTWDVKGQLTAIQGFTPACSPMSASFTYDVLGRRTGKTLNGLTTNFVYDGLTPVQEKQGAVTNNLLTGTGVDEYLARTDSAGTRYFLPNHLGSTLALSDSAGAITTRYSYEPYGDTTVTGEASANVFQYSGRENDGTGLYYYRARYYDPLSKRFISQDPIGLAGGLNLYAYVGNNPLSYTDPLGLQQFPLPASQQAAARAMGCAVNPAACAPSPNYCTGAPDLFPKSCQKHDECYTCAKKPQWQCDAEFYDDMRKERPDLPNLPLYYYRAVYFFGDNYYGKP